MTGYLVVLGKIIGLIEKVFSSEIGPIIDVKQGVIS